LEEYDKAIEDFNKAIELSPESDKLLIDRAQLYTKTGDFTSAIADYEKAISLAPDNSWAYSGAAYAIALNDGDLDKALEYINKALELTPDVKSKRDTQGFVYYKLGDYEKAMDIFNLLLYENYFYAYYGRGLVYYAMGENIKAVTDLNKFLVSFPDDMNSANAQALIDQINEQ
jgi:tetratricopeptide (TPR) repeat protein